jgi:hypothetical protein
LRGFVRAAGRDQAEKGKTEGLEMHWWQEGGARIRVVRFMRISVRFASAISART